MLKIKRLLVFDEADKLHYKSPWTHSVLKAIRMKGYHHQYLLSVVFLAIQLSCSEGLKYVYGPDNTGKAILIDLTPGAPPTTCPLNLPELPITELRCTATAFIHDKLTICGGSRTGFTSSFCFALDEENNKWIKFPSLPEPRNCPTSFLAGNNTWWLSGGMNNVNTGVVYDSVKNVWVPSLNLPIWGHGFCLQPLPDGRIMLLGGYKKIPVIKPIYNKNVYILQNREWVLQDGGLNRRIERFGFSQVCANNKDGSIMILGGKPTGKDNVEVWNSEFGFWSLAEDPLKLPLDFVWYPSSAYDEEGNVYVIGGESKKDGINASDRILKWDGKTWTIYDGALPFSMMFAPIAKLSPGSNLSC